MRTEALLQRHIEIPALTKLLIVNPIQSLTKAQGGAKMTRGVKVLLYIVGVGAIVWLIILTILISLFGTSQVQQAENISALATQISEEVEVATTAEPEETVVEPKVEAVIVQNDLEAPVLHHADSHAPEEGYGSFDVGVNQDQIGLVFGWHIAWPKGVLDAGGKGCDLIILTPGWYENLQILDGRYEIYTVPTTDYDGWVKVLGQQRADEQMANYSCPAKDFEEIPQWESSFPSPP